MGNKINTGNTLQPPEIQQETFKKITIVKTAEEDN